MSSTLPLAAQDIYRYRTQRGVNLGSWFVLERWITPRPFRTDSGASCECDLDIARLPNAKQILENHWDTWIQEDDWRWMVEHGINSVRIPIGYYHLTGVYPEGIKGTDFHDLGSVFEGAWTRIVGAISTAERYGISVLIDLHAAPGKQNPDSHSGAPGPHVNFFQHTNLSKTRKILERLLKTLLSLPNSNIVGLQLLNEPQNHPRLEGWYTDTLDALRKIDAEFPLYIHDAWSTTQYASHIKSRRDFIVLDHHLYRCFTTRDQSLSGEEHGRILREDPSPNFRALSEKGDLNFVIAEYSSALHPSSLRSSEAGEQDRQRRLFTRAELDLFEHTPGCGGSWFWCYKKQEGWDAGWNLRDAMRAEIVPSFFGIRLDSGGERKESCVESAFGRGERERDKALNAHEEYWAQFPPPPAGKSTSPSSKLKSIFKHRQSKSQSGEQPGEQYEHHRFALGFETAWADAFGFFSFKPTAGGGGGGGQVTESEAVSELGFKTQWLEKRVGEHVRMHGKGSVWEFEHGFMQGLQAARDALVSQLQQ